MPKFLTDIELLQQIARSDDKALTVLFDRYYQQLCRFVYVYIPDHEVVEELVSNIFIKIWENRKKIKIHTNLRAYLYKAAKNQALSYIRKKDMLVLYKNENSMEFNEIAPSPEASFIEKELNEEFVKAFRKIPPRAKMAFKLHRFDGLKYSEIAIIMNISVSAVEKNISTALKILHEELKTFTIIA